MKKILSAGGNRTDKSGNSPSVSVVLPRDMLTKIENVAWEKRITKSELIRQLIDKGLQNG